jgi:hypothetical protein
MALKIQKNSPKPAPIVLIQPAHMKKCQSMQHDVHLLAAASHCTQDIDISHIPNFTKLSGNKTSLHKEDCMVK